MRIILNLGSHLDWSYEKIEDTIEKLSKYFEGKYEYSLDPLEFDTFLIEISEEEYHNLVTTLDEYGITPNCIHIPYQTLCVNGDGFFEVIEENMEVSMLMRKLSKNVKLPRINLSQI